MKMKILTLGNLLSTAFVAILVFTAGSNIASAANTAKFVMSTNTPSVGQPVIFDGSASVCDNPSGCSSTWQWFWRTSDGATHVGGQMGRTPIITYTFDSFAASKPYVIVQLKVASGRLQQSSTASASFKVLP